MTDKDIYEKKPLFTFGPLGCMIIFWIGFVSLIFGLIMAVITGDSLTEGEHNSDVPAKYRYENRLNNTNGNYNYEDNEYLPNRKQGQLDSDNEDVEQLLDEFLKEFEQDYE